MFENTRTRRSKKQIAEARSRAKAAQDAEKARRIALPGRVAQLEDEIETEEQDRRKHSMRPDLRGAKSTDRALSG